MRCPPDSLVERVAGTISAHALFSPGDIVIVGVSGGSDSTALLDILSSLDGFNLRIIAAHVNHQLRGAASDEDEEFVRNIALSNGHEYRAIRCDVRHLAKSEGKSLEDAARDVRRSFFFTLFDEFSASAIALAHHADDQAETVLMNLIRGAGPDGLSGIRFKSPEGIVRPLLSSRKHDILSYIDSKGLSYREDESNGTLVHRRNVIRHSLIPLLETINPSLVSRVCDTAEICRDESDYINALAAAELSRLAVIGRSRIRIDCTGFRQLHHALRMRVLRIALQKVSGFHGGFSMNNLLALERMAAEPYGNQHLHLPMGTRAVREYEILVITAGEGEGNCPGLEEVSIEREGDYSLPWGGRLVVTFLDKPPAEFENTGFQMTAAIDALPLPWRVRTFRNGDRIMPFGMGGHRKVKSILNEARIPVSRRNAVPMLFCGDELLWVCGVRASELCRINRTSRRFCRLIYTP